MEAKDYTVEIVGIDSIQPSPENDDLYGAVKYDDQLTDLIRSIRSVGLEEPLIVSSDNYIMSGHRRYCACLGLGLKEIAVRRKTITRGENLSDWPSILADYNPQRIKGPATLLKESLLRFSVGDSYNLIKDYERESRCVDVEFMEVSGRKYAKPIGKRREPFLERVKEVLVELEDFLPSSVRAIHYRLLNDPPLTQTCVSARDPERWRYKNNQGCYNRLVELLTDARYGGEIDMMAIDDPTRPCFVYTGYENAAEFINQELEGFLCGYHCDRQRDQPRHIEVLGEKNTLLQILKPICNQYYVPLSLGRGYGSIPTWRNMAARFRQSGKTAMTLIIASDFDPEGFDLADDAIRSLRDQFGVPVEYHRVGVTEEQIKRLDLSQDFNPAKEDSSRLASFIERTGGKRTWELESLPPEYLQEKTKEAIVSNMNMDIFDQVIEKELQDADEIAKVRSDIARVLEI